MSYPFSNLSTVVLATDIPVLPVEELRAETTNVRAILSSGGEAAKTGCLIFLAKTFLFLYTTPTVLYDESWKLLLHVLSVPNINDKNGTFKEGAFTSTWWGFDKGKEE